MPPVCSDHNIGSTIVLATVLKEHMGAIPSLRTEYDAHANAIKRYIGDIEQQIEFLGHLSSYLRGELEHCKPGQHAHAAGTLERGNIKKTVRQLAHKLSGVKEAFTPEPLDLRDATC